MNYGKPNKLLNKTDYDAIVSIGNKCPTAIILRKLNLYNESFPFDYIPTTPNLILKYLQDETFFYPQKGEILNADNVWFGHFNVNELYNETITTFKRRFARLFDLLQNKKKILFVYTSEADIYNEMNNRYNNNYSDIQKIVDFIIDKYSYNNFKVLCIHTNKSFEDTQNIINYKINVPDKYLSDDMSTHTADIYLIYRDKLTNYIKEIFLI